MESSTIQESPTTSANSPAVSPEVLTDPSKQEVKALLAQARNVKEMIENFKAACEGASVSGHVAVRFAIGIQWLESMLRQNKADIERLQNECK